MNNTLLARVNIAATQENFHKVLEKYKIDLIEFQCTWNKYKSFADLPLEYQEAIQAGVDQYLEEVY